MIIQTFAKRRGVSEFFSIRSPFYFLPVGIGGFHLSLAKYLSPTECVLLLETRVLPPAA